MIYKVKDFATVGDKITKDTVATICRNCRRIKMNNVELSNL